MRYVQQMFALVDEPAVSQGTADAINLRMGSSSWVSRAQIHKTTITYPMGAQPLAELDSSAPYARKGSHAFSPSCKH